MRYIIILIILFVASCSEPSSNTKSPQPEDSYVEYVPVYRKNERLSRDTSITIAHKEAIKKVLTHYGHKWKEINGKIFYWGWIDEELLWNYTTKANDSTWLSANQQ